MTADNRVCFCFDLQEIDCPRWWSTKAPEDVPGTLPMIIPSNFGKLYFSKLTMGYFTIQTEKRMESYWAVKCMRLESVSVLLVIVPIPKTA